MSTLLSVPLDQLIHTEAAFLNLPTPGPASLPVLNPTKSYWLDSEEGVNPLGSQGSDGPLTQDADVCIIGSGITGVSAAWHLAKTLEQISAEGTKPLEVVILEARDFCSGATGRNGGHLTARSFLEFSHIKKAWGTDEALRSAKIEDHTAASITGFLKDQDLVDYADLVEGGHIALFFTREEEAAAREDYEAAKKAGLEIPQAGWISAEEMNKTYGTAYPGVLTPGYNLWPSKFVTKLFLAASESPSINLTLHTRTPVTSIAPSSSSSSSSKHPRRHTLQTPRGPIICTSVIHATNGYASHLLPQMAGPNGIIPTRGQVVALRAAAPLEEITKRSWYGNLGFEYWFPRPIKKSKSVVVNGDTQHALSANTNDKEAEYPLIILGGGREAETPDFANYVTDDSVVNEKAGKALRGFLPSVYPGKYEEERGVEMEWTGIMGFTKIGDPFVGPVKPFTKSNEGQFIAAGYHGHGMPRAFACAEAIAQIVLHELQGGKFEDWEKPEWLPERYLTRFER